MTLSSKMPVDEKLKRFFPFFLIIIIFVSRAPLITSNYFVADGDEAIIGLMAKEIVDKGDFKIYFWGQQYGLAVVETSTGALAFKVFGMNVYSLKLAMLALWTMGVLLLFAGVKNLSGWNVAAIFALLLIAFPAWGLWSMKARGGYITAFVFSAFTGWLISIIYKKQDRKTMALWILMGFSLVLIWFAQKLWLFSLIPFVVALCIKRPNLLGFLGLIISAFATSGLIHYLARNETSNFWGYNFEAKLYILYNIPTALKQLHVHFGGGYFLSGILRAGQINEAIGWAWSAVFALLLVFQVIRIITRKFLPLSHLFFLSACFSTVALFNNHSTYLDYRYLLPVDVPLVLCFIYECYDLALRMGEAKIFSVGMLVFAGFNYCGLFQLRNVHTESINEPPALPYSKAMSQTISFLKSRGIYYVFSPNPSLFWQTMFYSQKQIMARYFPNGDRNPQYTKLVTDAFKAGKPVALIDQFNATTLDPKTSKYKIDPARVYNFGNQLRVYLYPDRSILEKMQFDLK